jgi:hypothetical protein
MDWEPIPADRVADLATRGMADGDVILLHDSTRYGHRPDCSATVAAVGAIAERAAELGLRVDPLGDLAP